MSSKAPPLSTTPPPPPGGGSGKYLAVVVLLGLGLTALLFWKSCGSSSSAGPIAVTPVTSSTPSALPAIADDIPPPPVIEDSGTETHTTHSFSGNGCEQKSCSGTVTSDLETALAFRAKQAHRCYDSALAQDTTLQGHVKISVRVGYNGAVCGASVASNDLANSNVANCIANMFRGSGHLPTPKGGCVNTDVPIALMPPGQH